MQFAIVLSTEESAALRAHKKMRVAAREGGLPAPSYPVILRELLPMLARAYPLNGNARSSIIGPNEYGELEELSLSTEDLG